MKCSSHHSDPLPRTQRAGPRMGVQGGGEHAVPSQINTNPEIHYQKPNTHTHTHTSITHTISLSAFLAHRHSSVPMDPAARLIATAIRSTRAALLKINRLENDLSSVSLANDAFERRLSVYEDPPLLPSPPAQVPRSGHRAAPVGLCGLIGGRRSASVSSPTFGAAFPQAAPPRAEGSMATTAPPPGSKSPYGAAGRSGPWTQRCSPRPHRGRGLLGPSPGSPGASPGSSLAAHRIECLEYLLKEERDKHQVPRSRLIEPGYL